MKIIYAQIHKESFDAAENFGVLQAAMDQDDDENRRGIAQIEERRKVLLFEVVKEDSDSVSAGTRRSQMEKGSELLQLIQRRRDLAVRQMENYRMGLQ